MRLNFSKNILKSVSTFKKFPYDEGVIAFKEGFPLSNNPYQKTIIDHFIWHGGWVEAKKNSIEKQ